MLLEIEKIWKVYFHTTIDLLLEIETPNLRVTFRDLVIAEDPRKLEANLQKLMVELQK